jgi:hypothetical protein
MLRIPLTWQKSYGRFINQDYVFLSYNFGKKYNILVTSEVNPGFPDIFIWFGRIWQALPEYEYWKKFFSAFLSESRKKPERPIEIVHILPYTECPWLLITSADRLFYLFKNLGKVIIRFNLLRCIPNIDQQ